jgi:putative flippase GtrA
MASQRLVLNSDKNGGQETMTLDKHQQVKPGTTGVAYAELVANSLGSSRVSPKDEDTLSARWVSAAMRPFISRGDGKDSYLATIVSSRLFKFLVVGGLGVVVNLLVMALLIEVGYLRDWRASAIASAVAALHNYLLNNHWTFSDRRRNGRALLNGAFLYFPMSAVGIAITTVSYSVLSQARFRTSFGTSSLYLLGRNWLRFSLAPISTTS